MVGGRFGFDFSEDQGLKILYAMFTESKDFLSSMFPVGSRRFTTVSPDGRSMHEIRGPELE